MSTTTGGCQRGCPVLLRLGPLPQDIKAQLSYKDLHAYVCVLLEGSWGGAFCLLSLLGLLLLGRNRSREKADCRGVCSLQLHCRATSPPVTSQDHTLSMWHRDAATRIWGALDRRHDFCLLRLTGWREFRRANLV